MADNLRQAYIDRGITMDGVVRSTTPPPPLTSSYLFRVNFLGHDLANNQAYMDEIAWAESASGPQLATLGTVASSSNETNYDPNRARDRNNVNHWNTASGQVFPHWYEFNTGGIGTTNGPVITLFEVRMVSAGMSNPVMEIVGWDGTKFVVMRTIPASETAGWTTGQDRTFVI